MNELSHRVGLLVDETDKRIEKLEDQMRGVRGGHTQFANRFGDVEEQMRLLAQRLEKLAAPAVHQPTAPVGPWSRQIYACTPGHPDRETWEHPAGRVEQWSRIEAAARHLVAMAEGTVPTSALRRLRETLGDA